LKNQYLLIVFPVDIKLFLKDPSIFLFMFIVKNKSLICSSTIGTLWIVNDPKEVANQYWNNVIHTNERWKWKNNKSLSYLRIKNNSHWVNHYNRCVKIEFNDKPKHNIKNNSDQKSNFWTITMSTAALVQGCILEGPWLQGTTLKP